MSGAIRFDVPSLERIASTLLRCDNCCKQAISPIIREIDVVRENAMFSQDDNSMSQRRNCFAPSGFDDWRTVVKDDKRSLQCSDSTRNRQNEEQHP